MKTRISSTILLIIFLGASSFSQGWQFVGPDSVTWQFVNRVSGTWMSPSLYRLAAVTGRGICFLSNGQWAYGFVNINPSPAFPGMTYYFCEFSPWSPDTFYVGYSETDMESYFRLMRISFGGGLWQQVNPMGCWSTPFSVVSSPHTPVVIATACGFHRSTDRGNTWTSLDSIPIAIHLTKMLAFDNSSDQILYRSGYVGPPANPNALFRSTNQGASWDSIFNAEVRAIFTESPYSVFAQGDSILVGIRSGATDTSRGYGIFRSTNRGLTWSRVYTRGRVVGIVKSNVSVNTLLAASEEGILKSVDFGSIWTMHNNSLPTTRLTSLIISPYSDTMFVSTETHGVLKVWEHLTGVGANQTQPVKSYLFQNYPNPFNPSTTISFSIPHSAFATLKVYDVLGREVATLVNDEEMRPGRYERTFDGSGLASGVYFYRLQAGGFVQSRKLLLLR